MKQIKVHYFLLLVMAVFTFSSCNNKTLDNYFDSVNWQADINSFQRRGLITTEEHRMLVHYIELPTTSANVNVPYRTVLLHAEREKQDEKQAQLAEGRYVQISPIQVVYDEYLNPFIFIEITNLTDKDIEIRYVVRQFWSEFDTYITRETIFYEVDIASRDRITKFESAGFDNTTRSAVLEVRIIEIYFDGEYFGIPGQRQLLLYVPSGLETD